jgi:hypothetical protein
LLERHLAPARRGPEHSRSLSRRELALGSWAAFATAAAILIAVAPIWGRLDGPPPAKPGLSVRPDQAPARFESSASFRFRPRAAAAVIPLHRSRGFDDDASGARGSCSRLHARGGRTRGRQLCDAGGAVLQFTDRAPSRLRASPLDRDSRRGQWLDRRRLRAATAFPADDRGAGARAVRAHLEFHPSR